MRWRQTRTQQRPFWWHPSIQQAPLVAACLSNGHVSARQVGSILLYTNMVVVRIVVGLPKAIELFGLSQIDQHHSFAPTVFLRNRRDQNVVGGAIEVCIEDVVVNNSPVVPENEKLFVRDRDFPFQNARKPARKPTFWQHRERSVEIREPVYQTVSIPIIDPAPFRRLRVCRVRPERSAGPERAHTPDRKVRQCPDFCRHTRFGEENDPGSRRLPRGRRHAHRADDLRIGKSNPMTGLRNKIVMKLEQGIALCLRC